MNNKMPLISIIVPVYNKKIEHLKKCFDSLVEQTYSNVEIIIVDDGSSLDVADFCEAYSSEKRCRYYRNRHKGVSSARNFGIEKSRGDYVMFVDSDDWLDYECCEYFYRNSYYGKYDLIAFSYVKEYPTRKKLVAVDGSMYGMPVLGSSCMKFYKRKIINNNFLFDETLENAEDVEFNFRVFKDVSSYRFEQKNFYHYRIIADSAVRRFDKDIISKYEKTIATVREDVDEKDNEQFRAYISFLGIVYLMLLLNHVFNSSNRDRDYRKQLRRLSNLAFVKVLFINYNYLTLPFTRRFPIFLAKKKWFFVLKVAISIKKVFER